MSRGRKVTEAYPLQQMHKVFLVSGALFAFAMGWMFWDDYDRPWKGYQREYILLQQQKKHDELKQIGKLEKQVAGLDARILTLEANLGAKEKIAKVQAQIEVLETAYGPAVQAMKFKKADVDAFKFKHDLAASHLMHARQAKHGVKEALANRDQAKRDLDKVRMVYDSLIAAVQKIAADLQTERKKLTKLEVGNKDAIKLAQLQKKRAPLAAKLDKLRKQKKQLSRGLGFWLRNAPMLDMLNPNLKVEQVVLPDMKIDIIFANVQTVDRCMTCHLPIDKPGWDKKKYKHPFRSHPNLDLFMGSTSPHPMLDFGCRSCHRGMGRATDFVRATHTPETAKQQKRWEKQYGWHMLHDKQWKKPQWQVSMIETGCVSCHDQIVDLQPMPWTQKYAKRKKSKKPRRPGIYAKFAGQKVYEGKQLFLRKGCNGCHLVASLKDVPKVGPSLERVASKLDIPFLRRWIEAPREFRPNTYMPHIFKIKHHLDQLADVDSTTLDFGSLQHRGSGKSVKKMLKTYPKRKGLLESVQHAEIAAISEYLYQNSAPLTLGTPQVENESAARRAGKSLFRDKGCLGCHKMKGFEVAGEAKQRFAPDLSQVGSKFAGGTGKKWLYTWLLDPRSYHRESRMPNPRLSKDEAANLAVYLDSLKLKGKRAKRFKKLLKAGDVDGDLVDMRLVTFLEGNMRTDQAWAIIGLLKGKKGKQVKRAWLGEKVISKQGCFGCHLMPKGTFVSNHIAGDAKLKGFLENNNLSKFVKPAQFNGMPGIGTELSAWGTKLMTKLDFGLRHDLPHTRWDFIINKLKTPRMFDEGLFKVYDDMLRMPHFDLSDDEARKISMFVMGQEKTKLAPRYIYADSDRNLQRRPWEMEAVAQSLADKPLSSWGASENTQYVEMLRRLTRKSKKTRLQQILDRLAQAKRLGKPQPKKQAQSDLSFALREQGRVEGRTAPQWVGGTSRRRAIIEGRKLVQQFNCQGCHLIEGRGWELRDYITKYRFPGLVEGEEDMASPPLLSQMGWVKKGYQARWRNFQGNRTKTAWLFNFLRDPDSSPTLRPWLKTKMPNFHMSVSQANTMTRYFAALAGTAWPNAANDVLPSKQDYKTAVKIFSKNDCFGCHIAKQAVGKKGAPDLERAGSRLRAEWVEHWINKPTHFIPFTDMPSNQVPTRKEARAVTRVIMSRKAMQKLMKDPDAQKDANKK